MFFARSPWAANCPHLGNLTPVCNFTFGVSYSLSFRVFLTAFSHTVAVFSEVQAKVTQMLSMKTQPGIRDGWTPRGSLRLEFKQNLPTFSCKWHFILFSCNLPFGFPLGNSTNKNVHYFYIPLACKYFLTHAHTSYGIVFTVKWYLQSFSAQFSLQEPRCSFWGCKWLGRAGSNLVNGSFHM